MRTVFSNLLAASLLIHAMIGCCWHHAHDEMCCDQSPAEQTAEDGCCHHHHTSGSDQQHGQPSSAPCSNPSHCRGLCTYLPTQKTQIDKVELPVPFHFAVLIVPATGNMHGAALLHTEWLNGSVAGPPVRLHLFHQILLI